MRIVRISHRDAPAWGVVDATGQHVRLLSGTPFDEVIRYTGVQTPLVEADLLAPVVPSKIYCLGRNYADHVVQMGYEELGPPSLFMKGPTTIVGPGGTVVIPSPDVDGVIEHEAELAIVIGRTARNVRREDAADVILGYTCADDVSARTLQRGDPYPTRGKGFDTFCPVGPWVDTEFDPHADARIGSRVNGEPRLEGTTGQMTYDVGAVVEFVSSFSTLLPGDLILTGAPGGPGGITAGDRVEIEIEGLGTLVHDVAFEG